LNVHQLLSGAGPVDAVTNQARAYRRLFSQWGWGGGDHAVYVDPRAGRDFGPLDHLAPAPDDVLLFHYSAYAPRLAAQLERPQRKLLVSHNVTPAEWFWDYEPMTAVQCTVGREQLPRFAAAVDLAAGVSAFNARELDAAGARDTAVVPILFDGARLGEPTAPPAGPPSVLSVGRISPHKRHDLLIRAFALYRRERAPDARLVLVGEPLTPLYGEAVRELGERLAPGAVEIVSMLDADALAARWRAAHAFVSLSEHEGFCIPLLEAFHFGVPVVARAAGGVPEVAGDAALLLEEPTELAVVAELIHLAVGDVELRAELTARGRARLAAYAPEATAAKLRAAIEAVANGLQRRPGGDPEGEHRRHQAE
jgi:glycosyltransferase involved in cell wall biosynthesis